MNNSFDKEIFEPNGNDIAPDDRNADILKKGETFEVGHNEISEQQVSVQNEMSTDNAATERYDRQAVLHSEAELLNKINSALKNEPQVASLSESMPVQQATEQNAYIPQPQQSARPAPQPQFANQPMSQPVMNPQMPQQMPTGAGYMPQGAVQPQMPNHNYNPAQYAYPAYNQQRNVPPYANGAPYVPVQPMSGYAPQQINQPVMQQPIPMGQPYPNAGYNPQYAPTMPNQQMYQPMPQTVSALNQQDNNKKGKGGKIVLTIGGIILGLVLLFFAVYGIIAMTQDLNPANGKQNIVSTVPEQSQPGLPDNGNTLPDFDDETPQQGLPDQGNDFGNGYYYYYNEPQANPSDLKLGIVVSEVTEQMVQLYNVPRGLILTQINDDSSLKDEKVQLYDIITEADGQKIETTEQLHALFEKHEAGDTITLTLTRVKEDGTLYTYDFEAELMENDQKGEQSQSSPQLNEDISRPTA